MTRRPCSALQVWPLLLGACMLWGTVESPSRKHQLRQVDGVVGGSVSLLLNLVPGEMGDKSHLDFRSRHGERLELAVFMGGQWKRSVSPDRFGQRLELAKETTVRITGLEMEDSGLFQFSLRLPPAKVWYHTFNLTVHTAHQDQQLPSKSSSEDHVVLTVLIVLTLLGCLTYAGAITVMCWRERRGVKRKENLLIPVANQDLEEGDPLLVKSGSGKLYLSPRVSERARPPPC